MFSQLSDVDYDINDFRKCERSPPKKKTKKKTK